ncbi:MAG TPA: hypothetical protein VGC47_15055 [Acidimicrobiia bacterium]|jgi:hypothetical protein
MKTLVKLGIVGAIAYAVARVVRRQKFEGLTEPELRDKLAEKFGSRLTPERLEKLQDKVVAMVRARGKLVEPDGTEPSPA